MKCPKWQFKTKRAHPYKLFRRNIVQYNGVCGLGFFGNLFRRGGVLNSFFCHEDKLNSWFFRFLRHELRLASFLFRE